MGLTPADLAVRFYTRFMGVGREKLGWDGINKHPVSLSKVLYYSYRKGFWPFLRGLLFRPRLHSSGGLFFLGRYSTILFPAYFSVGRNVSVGDFVFINCISQDGIVFGNNVRIREHAWIQATSHLTDLGKGLRIGDNTFIGPHCTLGAGGGITIGQDVTLGAYVQLLAENHNFSDSHLKINEQGVSRQGIVIEDDCWLGNSVVVLDGVHIGEGAVVGAASVVTHDIPARSIAVGNPARVIKQRSFS